MKLSVNGNEIEHGGDSVTVKELLTSMRYSFPLIVVRVNGILVTRDAYGSVSVKNGDVVDAYHLVSGG
ncbi:MAG: sulfur carrier protein ThiS [Rectinemataceae bacterium]|jgi:thiamine biosynthesis protein ThiS